MSYNKVVLIGLTGADPEYKKTDSGASYALFPLATTERGYTTKSGVTVPDHTDWHRVKCFNQQADWVGSYVKKGSGLIVEGRIRYEEYYDKATGVKRYITFIMAEKVGFFSIGNGQKKSEDSSSNAVKPRENGRQTQEENYDLPF